MAADSCKNEHPGRNQTTTRNLFAPLQNNNRSNQAGPNTSNRGARSSDLPYYLDKDIISKDLTNERPLYILSAYGPGRDAPQQLFGGHPRELTVEELRHRHYELAAAGNLPQAIQEAQTLYNDAEQQIRTVLSDLNGAIKYITDAANQHPNRLDICNAKGGDPSQAQRPPSNTQAGARGASTGQAFGQPSFGKPTAPAFGQSSFGQTAAPAFGNPSFGQSSAPAPAFGQPSGLGQRPTVFGQASNSSPSPAFGQPSVPSPFGQAQQAPKPFEVQQPQQQPIFGQQTNAFGQQPPTGPKANVFGSQQTSNSFAKPPTAAPANPFGQPPVPQAPSPFDNPSAHQPASNQFGFEDTSRGLGTFGPPKQTPATAFGQPAVTAPTGIFGKLPAQTSNGQAAQPNSAGMFGKPAAQPASSGIFGNRPATSAGSTAPSTQTKQGAPSNAKFGQDQSGNRILVSWQGQKVEYIDDDPCIKHPSDGGWQKIWFPEGPPTFTSKTQEYPDGYVLDDAARENFKHFVQHGVGSDGLIPDMPPPRDMISWNF